MLRYSEIDELDEIHAANAALTKVLKRGLQHREQRTIGYPNNFFVEEVRFGRSRGETFWWHGGDSANGDMLLHFFGHAVPGCAETLLIGLQVNFHAHQFDRTTGGVFVRDRETGEILLGHRGILTRGKSRMPKDMVFAEANTPIVEIGTRGRATIPVFLAGPIGHPRFIDLLSEFCLELRRTAGAVAEQRAAGAKTPGGRKTGASRPMAAVSDYFDEFSGRAGYRRGGRVIADWAHGRIVAALKDALPDGVEAKKNRECDLIALAGKRVILFEVKTQADTQSLYTGVGQLVVHTDGLQRRFPGKSIEPVLVAPFEKLADPPYALLERLGIQALSVSEDGGTYDFGRIIRLGLI